MKKKPTKNKGDYERALQIARQEYDKCEAALALYLARRCEAALALFVSQTKKGLTK